MREAVQLGSSDAVVVVVVDAVIVAVPVDSARAPGTRRRAIKDAQNGVIFILASVV
jgi:CRISPR/Cas system CMR subunit Cmr4 (Cas7 group RAMP superfamily)